MTTTEGTHIRFEADVLRTALLLGLVREHEVIAWADALLGTEPDPYAHLAEVALARPELTTVREALRPLAEPNDPAAVGKALLAFIASDPAATRLAVRDRLRVLSQLRREAELPASVSDDIELLADRSMLAAAGVSSERAVSETELATWLASARSPGYYRIALERDDECAALLGALSRTLVRERRWESAEKSAGGRAWVVRATDEGGTTLMLNDALWQIAIREFSPLPVASRVPYSRVPSGAVMVLDESTAEPMGAADASDCLASVQS
ncbi:MAG: hypothetical protein JWM41_1748 [Gemmatimonadetes bacterium]|nr:hypothetical protein [Gemmatimonadota bacterium]